MSFVCSIFVYLCHTTVSVVTYFKWEKIRNSPTLQFQSFKSIWIVSKETHIALKIFASKSVHPFQSMPQRQADRRCFKTPLFLFGGRNSHGGIIKMVSNFCFKIFNDNCLQTWWGHGNLVILVVFESQISSKCGVIIYKRDHESLKTELYFIY